MTVFGFNSPKILGKHTEFRETKRSGSIKITLEVFQFYLNYLASQNLETVPVS